MAMKIIHRAALAFRSSRRLLSSSTTSSPSLLGHFYHPFSHDRSAYREPPSSAPAFQPLTASSPRLSLDFLPDLPNYFLRDSHLGLLLLHEKGAPFDGRRRFLVCDPVSRRHALLQPPPVSRINGGEVVGAAVLSREADLGGGLRFEVVCVAVDVDRPRAWVASFRDGWCQWSALPRSRDATVDFSTHAFERTCVHAAGGLYWHILHHGSALALDAATMEFSFIPAPTLMWDFGVGNVHKYRIGEMPEDGRLCVRGEGKGTDNGWVLERHTRMKEVLDTVPWLPKTPIERQMSLWLSDIDGGRTGKVFIHTLGFGSFSYHMDTGKLDSLATEDGMMYGRPIFAYFSAPDGCSA